MWQHDANMASNVLKYASTQTTPTLVSQGEEITGLGWSQAVSRVSSGLERSRVVSSGLERSRAVSSGLEQTQSALCHCCGL